jgi:Global regulator protein family
LTAHQFLFRQRKGVPAMLVLSRKENQQLIIGDNIVVRVL